MEALPQAPWSGKAARFMANSSTPHLWAHVRQFFLKSLMLYIFFGWCRCDGAMSSHKTLVKTFAFGPKHCMMTGGNQPTMAGTRVWSFVHGRRRNFAVPCSFSWRFHLLERARQEWKTADTWFILKTDSTEGGVTVLRRWHDAETLTFRHGDLSTIISSRSASRANKSLG